MRPLRFDRAVIPASVAACLVACAAPSDEAGSDGAAVGVTPTARDAFGLVG